MDRIQLKTDAKDAMRTANPHPVLVALIYTVIVAAVQMIISTFSGFSSMLTSIFGGDSASIFILGMLLPTLLTSIVASFVVAFLELGFVGYTLRVINRQPAGISDLFAYARLFLKAWGLSFMIGLFVGLWSLLFWIPGIIASYRYSQAYYILAENPEKGIMDCIRESKSMMIGHKMDKFILDLSFIPWYLLTIVTCGIASIYVTPYTSVTNAAFYNTLRYGRSSQAYGQNQGYGQNWQQGGYQQGGYQQGYDPNWQQNGYNQGGWQQGYDPNAQQGGYNQNGWQQGYDPNAQQGGYNQGGWQQQGYDPNAQQNGWQQQNNGADGNQNG